MQQLLNNILTQNQVTQQAKMQSLISTSLSCFDRLVVVKWEQNLFIEGVEMRLNF